MAAARMEMSLRPVMGESYYGDKFGLREGARADESLHRLGVGRHHFHPLRKLLEPLETRGPRRVLAERLDDGFVELRGKRGFEADHRVARLPHAKRDLHAVGGMGIDHLRILLLHEADGRDAVLVPAAARDESRVLLDLLPRLVGREVEPAVLLHLLPEPRDLVAVAVDRIPDEALEVG